MDTQTLLNKLDTAYKAITTTDMGQGLLTEEKASQFIRVVQDSTPLLSLSRRLPMNSHTRDIDRIAFAGRILQKTGGQNYVVDIQPSMILLSRLW